MPRLPARSTGATAGSTSHSSTRQWTGNGRLAGRDAEAGASPCPPFASRERSRERWAPWRPRRPPPCGPVGRTTAGEPDEEPLASESLTGRRGCECTNLGLVGDSILCAAAQAPYLPETQQSNRRGGRGELIRPGGCSRCTERATIEDPDGQRGRAERPERSRGGRHNKDVDDGIPGGTGTDDATPAHHRNDGPQHSRRGTGWEATGTSTAPGSRTGQRAWTTGT